MFATYEEAKDENIFMGNSSSSKVHGVGKVILKMTSEKELTLNNVLHVPEIRRNLVSWPMLSKNDFRMIFESDKFVLMKTGAFVERGYLCDGLFKMNVMTIIPKVVPSNVSNKISSSSYLLESFNLWHHRLGQVNYKSINKLVNKGLLPKLNFEQNSKCEVCIEAKIDQNSF